MALDPMIARGSQPVDVTNTLAQIAALRQRDQGLQQSAQQNALYAQKFQAEQDQDDEDDAEWDQAYAAKDWATMARLDPQAAKVIYEHENPQAKQPGALYKLQDGTYADASKAQGQQFYQEPHQGPQPTDAPSDQRLYQWYASLPPEKQEQFLNMRRSNATPDAAAAIAGAKTTATEQAKAKVGAQTDLPRVDANADQMLANLDQFEKHPGTRFLYGGYGIAPIVPGTPQADAAAVLEQIGGKAFLEAFNTLKGGGQITEKEGEKATAAITRLGNRKQSYAGAKQAVAELRAIVKAGASRARQKAGTDQPRRRKYNPETGTIE
jgi:hypothetical protein